VLVTRPIENAINGVSGVQKLRSTSIQRLSVVTAFFDPAGDIYRDRPVVAERLAVAAQQFPEGTPDRLAAGAAAIDHSLAQAGPRTLGLWRRCSIEVPGTADM
jgi:Cu/Ag efflux pump CusA